MALDRDQQEKLELFKVDTFLQSLTQETDDEQCINALMDCGWDPQAAINRYLVSDQANAMRAANSRGFRRESQARFRRQSVQPSSQPQAKPRLIIWFLTALLSMISSIIGYFIRSLLAPIKEISTTEFQIQFERSLVANCSDQPPRLHLFRGSITEPLVTLLTKAYTHIYRPLPTLRALSSLSLYTFTHKLTVIPQHFAARGILYRDILGNPTFITHVNTNFIFWSSSISTREGFRISQTLDATCFPFLAVVVVIDSQWYALERIQGLLTIDETMRRLLMATQDANSQLTVHRLEREERVQNQLIRQEQDQAYEMALTEDRLKEQQKREEAQRQERERELARQRDYEERQSALDEQRRKEILKEQRAVDYVNLPNEPEAKDKDTVQIVFKMPGGERLQRRFSKQDKIMHLYHFVGGQENCEIPDAFLLCSNFPRKEFANHHLSLVEADLTSSAMLFVQDVTE